MPSLPGDFKDSVMMNAMKAGNYVLAEKPPFANLKQAEKFVATLSDNKIDSSKCIIGWHYMHHPSMRTLINQVKAGKFGKLTNLRAEFNWPKEYSKDHRMFDIAQGGAGLDLYCYCLHAASIFSGFDCKSPEILDNEIKNAGSIDPNLKEVDM